MLIAIDKIWRKKGSACFCPSLTHSMIPFQKPVQPFPHGLGICMLLLTIAHPCTTKTPTIGCTSSPIPRFHTPPMTPSLPPSIMPLHTHHAMHETIPNEVGMGVPSKYRLLPVLSFGNEETVTLNRARRVRPQRTKKDRRRVSSGVRRPSANEQTAGATPNDIWEKGQTIEPKPPSPQ